MSPPELLEALIELAREVGIEVRSRRPGADEALRSGAGRLRDRVFVLLSTGDPLEDQIAALAGALRENAAEAFESRYLAPALRNVLEPPSGS